MFIFRFEQFSSDHHSNNFLNQGMDGAVPPIFGQDGLSYIDSTFSSYRISPMC